MTDETLNHLDVTGTCCPWPLVRLAQAIRALRPGEQLRIVGNDPLLRSSVEDYCNTQGHAIVSVTDLGGRRVEIVIRLRGPDHGA